MNGKYTHLHLHTEYSLLNGVGRINDIVYMAKKMKMDSIAITDSSVMYGCVPFFKAAKKAGIKPIIGCEFDFNYKDMNKKYQIIMLVKNPTGYANLIKLVTISSQDPQNTIMDINTLMKYHEGLVAICSFYDNSILFTGPFINSSTKILLSLLKDTFKDDLYLEIQNHNIDAENKLTKDIMRLAVDMDVPLVATNNVHYVEQSDADAFDLLISMKQATTIDKMDRGKFLNDQYYLKSTEEMRREFNSIAGAIDNTQNIVDKCNFEYEFHVSKIPKYPLTDDVNSMGHLQQLCLAGLEVYLSKFSVNDKTHTSIYYERIQYELSVINKMGYVDYFLIVKDFIDYAKSRGITTGPGRGSGAGSLVAFTLGITKIDPLKYGLVFERFLNPERVSMPDIDCDFCYRRRQEIIDYVVKKYGRENVSQIITFGTFAAKTCIRDFGKVLNFSPEKIEIINKLIPNMQGKVVTLAESIETIPQLESMYTNESDVKLLFDLCKKLEGSPRHISTHAAGIVIAAEPLVNIIPLQEHDGSLLTQFDMTILEELGLLKIDFLGLKTLTVINDTVKIIEDIHHNKIDLDNIDCNDKAVYDMLGKGNTIGVFQLESPGMTSFIKELKPDCLEDIIAGISLYRPGPMAEIPKYIENKKDPQKIQYLSPQLKPILDVTYGCLIYQEQVMEIVRTLGGYSMGRSDLVRRAMSKKKHDVMEEERKTFIFGKTENGVRIISGCIQNGVEKEVAEKIFDVMIDFASYAFNKSHAVAYAVLAFQTAYLVHYYPAEYMAAKLNSCLDNSDKTIFYLKNLYKMNIHLKGPDINESIEKVTVYNNSVIIGFEMVKGVGNKAAQSIVDTRKNFGEYNSFADFVEKVNLRIVNRKAIEGLIKAGCFDSLGEYRSRLLSVYEEIYNEFSITQKDSIAGQMSLFENLGQDAIKYPIIPESNRLQLLAMEKEAIGIYISGHPLDEYLDFLSPGCEEIGNLSLKRSDDKEDHSIAGIVTHITQKQTKNRENMMFLTLEDKTGEIEVIVFPDKLLKFNNLIRKDAVVAIKGKFSQDDDKSFKIICNSIYPIQIKSTSKIYIRIQNRDEITTIQEFFRNTLYPYIGGNIPVYIYIQSENKTYILNREWWFVTDDVLPYLKKYFGKDNIQTTFESRIKKEMR